MRGRIALHLDPGLGWTKPLVVACCALCGTELARNRRQDAAARAARHVRCPTCGTRAARRLPGTTSPATDLALTRRRPRRRHSASTTPPWEEPRMAYRSLWQIDMGDGNWAVCCMACRIALYRGPKAGADRAFRSGELLGLRRRRVYPELRRIEVIEVRYEAGRFGRGFKAEPRSPASVRVVPMCEQVRQAIGRQLPAGARPDDLVFPGPGGSNGIPRGARTPLSTHNLRRVYQAAVAAAGEDLAHLDLHGPHDLRHTFATWLEDAGIPSRVIDELMGHTGGRRQGGASGSPMGRVYRETTPTMLARVTAALDERIGRAVAVAGNLPCDAEGWTGTEAYQGDTWILDSPEGVCAGQARFEYPATSVLFSNNSPALPRAAS